MAISWFCHGCLSDIEGEVPINSQCEYCINAKKTSEPYTTGTIAGASPSDTNN